MAPLGILFIIFVLRCTVDGPALVVILGEKNILYTLSTVSCVRCVLLCFALHSSTSDHLRRSTCGFQFPYILLFNLLAKKLDAL